MMAPLVMDEAALVQTQRLDPLRLDADQLH
jgi:hypothetical protein